MTRDQALACIDPKDWMRAKTVQPNRIMAMFDAIKDDRKLVGRVLAFYYTYRYIYVSSNDRNRILRRIDWLFGILNNGGLLDENTIDALKNLPLNEVRNHIGDNDLLRWFDETNNTGSRLGFFNEDLSTKDLTYFVLVRESTNSIMTTKGWENLNTLSKTSNLRIFGTEKKALGYLKSMGWTEEDFEADGIFPVKIDFTVSPRNKTRLGFFKEHKQKLGESLLLSKEELNNKLQELKTEFPDKFKDINAEELLNTFKGITIDYLDGCTDLEFREDGEPEGTIVDITGNSTDILNQPAYKNLMSKVFEGIIDEWLEDHNLTHGDIVSLEYDADTQQIFVTFDANEIEFNDYEDIEPVKEPDELDTELEEELEESFTREALTEMQDAWYTILKASQIYPQDLFLEIDSNDENRLQLTALIDGDWRADHIRFKKLVEETADKIGWKIIHSHEEPIQQTADSDTFQAYHYYVFDTSNPVSEEFVNLAETYSDEELDKLVGKTFNQQKIQNIYRRQKYNDSRLFAHTRCVKCGREKRVFLSNLINDPDKYGSCTCSDTNVESRLDNIQDLFNGSKKLSSNTSGYTGVSYVKTYKGELYDKWRAYIEVDGKRTYLGDFDSKSAAIRARKKAAEKGIKWYKEHKNEFMKNYRKKTKRYRKSHK